MSPEAEPARMRDYGPDLAQFRQDVVEGLSDRSKHLPCKYLYDKRGSELFERICELEEYYPTRTELAIMEEAAGEMAAELGPRIALVEYGSGSSVKTTLLLDRLEDPVAYIPIDISEEALRESALRLARAYPSLEVLPVLADYTDSFELPRPQREYSRRGVYFPGSTIGNFTEEEATEFLRRVARVVGSGGGLLIGVDLRKDPEVLVAAYDDAEGVTASFNKNLLVRINDELGGNFDQDAFKHVALWNGERSRMEMYLVSQAPQRVRVGPREFLFRAGEAIHTEYSYKYTLEHFAKLAAAAGFTVEKVWTDPDRLFSVQSLTVP